MTLGSRLRALLGARGAGGPRVHLLARGRFGPTWLDADRTLSLPPGATLATLLEAAEREGIPLQEAIARSPHAAATLMVNGERCPLPREASRLLRDGDEVYLLGPIAGG